MPLASLAARVMLGETLSEVGFTEEIVPPHVAVKVSDQELADAARAAGIAIDKHRDGTTGIYIHDPFGNAVELICYPPGATVYEKSSVTDANA